MSTSRVTSGTLSPKKMLEKKVDISERLVKTVTRLSKSFDDNRMKGIFHNVKLSLKKSDGTVHTTVTNVLVSNMLTKLQISKSSEAKTDCVVIILI